MGRQTVRRDALSVLIVEPGEVHALIESTPGCFHYAAGAPVVKGDRHSPR